MIPLKDKLAKKDQIADGQIRFDDGGKVISVYHQGKWMPVIYCDTNNLSLPNASINPSLQTAYIDLE